MQLTVDDFLGPEGAAARCLPGFEDRSSQRQMAQAVLRVLQEGGVVAVEAPTGVGKTLAYLVAAVLSGRKVLVSTHTKTLQDQILDKDLPLLERLLAEVGGELVRATPHDGPPQSNEVRYALMKGRSNYLCRARLDRRTEQAAFAFAGRDSLSVIRDWARETERGDRAELDLPEDDPIWPELDARSEICTGSRCPRYDDCFIGRMRREAQLADIIVVNHHLLLSDLALRAAAELSSGSTGYGEVVPQAEALIVDEAHTLEAAASEYFGGHVSGRQLERLGRDVTAYGAEVGPTADGARMGLLLSRAASATKAMFSALPAREGRVRFSSTRAQPQMKESRDRLPEAEAALVALADYLEHEGDPQGDGLARRTRDLAANLRFVLEAKDGDYVYWSERTGSGGALGASPIVVSSLLSQHLFDRFGAVALCSATLSAGDGKLDYFVRSVGAPEDTEVVLLDSPYDYGRQAALYVPQSGTSPDDPQAETRLATDMEALVRMVGGGALLLFTSRRMMRRVHQRLQGRLPHPLLLQGEQPKRELLRSFVARSPAVLCGTASFWEGVDVPGDALRLVVIDRLPFDSPADPLMSARAEQLERRGRSAFAGLQLPRAILRFKQGFGRLVRSRTDRGIVAVLDGRLSRRNYGRRFVAALPPARRIHTMEDLTRWWNHGPS